MVSKQAAKALALTTRFYHPAVAMKGWETLSRASAFLVKASPYVEGIGFHVVVSAHVCRPFLFPNYYDPERYPFVHVLGDENVRCSIGLQDDNGQQMAELPLRPTVRIHPSRDVAVAHLEDVSMLIEAAERSGLSLEPLDLIDELATDGEALTFHGHVLRSHGAGADESVLVPHHAHGHLLARSDVQTFARTHGEVLEMGMCGGPICRESDGACVGIVEGIVPSAASDAPPAGSADETPRQKAARLLGGSAVMIDSLEIAKFVRSVERQLR